MRIEDKKSDCKCLYDVSVRQTERKVNGYILISIHIKFNKIKIQGTKKMVKFK